jgi:small subunit ribosomal protein S24e
MDIKITEQKENKLLKRKEVRFDVAFSGATPSRKQVKEELCKLNGWDAGLFTIDALQQGFGTQSLAGYGKLYENADAAKVEMQYRKDRDEGVKPQKGEQGGGAKGKEAKKE